MPNYYMHDYMLLHAAFLHYMLNYIILSNYYMALHAAFLHYMLNYMILNSYYMIFCLQLHVLAIYYMPHHVTSLVAAAAEAPRAIATRAISARASAHAISSPFSVGFILPENDPAHGDCCEVLAAYWYGDGQHDLLAQLKLSSADGGPAVLGMSRM